MRHAYISLIVLVVGALLVLWLLLCGPGDALATPGVGSKALEKRLPDAPKCSLLNRYEGKKLWRHWIWHLSRDRAEYQRVCATVSGESGWQPGVEDYANSGHFGLFQFAAGWYRGIWWPYKFDPCDPVLSIRIFFYFIHGPHYGGWSNWAGH